MTTIAYNHDRKEIAYDGRTTRGGVIISDESEKMIERNGVKFFLCGSTCDYEILIAMYFGEKQDIVPEANAFAVDSGVVYMIGCGDNGVLWKSRKDCNDSIGSGWEYALAAMDFGRFAKQAVEYAATRDSSTGGKITVVGID